MHSHSHRWSHEQRTRLIQLVRQFEVLWRPSANSNRINCVRRDALNQIQRHFASEGFSVNDIREQWRNLRDIFYKRYALMIRRAELGEPMKRVLPCWRYFDQLQFLASEKALRGGYKRGPLSQSFDEAMARRRAKGIVDGEDGEIMGGNSAQWEDEPIDDEDEDQQSYDDEKVDEQRAVIKVEELLELDSQRDEMEERSEPQPALLAPATASFPMPVPAEMAVNEFGHPPAPTEYQQQKQRRSAQQQLGIRPLVKEQKMKMSQRNWALPVALARQNKLANRVGSSTAEQISVSGSERPLIRQDRLMFFGSFVESAVRDLQQQSPELSRRLMQSIYSTISAHQMEATNSL